MDFSLIISLFVTSGFLIWQLCVYIRNRKAAEKMKNFFLAGITSDYSLLEEQDGKKYINCSLAIDDMSESTSLPKLIEELNKYYLYLGKSKSYLL